MSPQANVQVAQRWFEEVWNQRRTETVYELSRPDSVGHMEHGDVTGPEPFLAFHTEFVKTFPDVKIVVEGVVAEGGEVVVRWLASATHLGVMWAAADSEIDWWEYDVVWNLQD